MKLSDKFQYVILCEDAQMKSFLLAFFHEQGIGPRKIRVRDYPAGKGCGEAFVKKEYPKEIQYLIKRSYNNNVLVVCVDADNKTCLERQRELDCIVNKTIPDERKENILAMIWIPKREIETWIAFFRGEKVNETDTYRHTGKPVSCKVEAKKMNQYLQGVIQPDTTDVPSLEQGRKEYNRICEMQTRE